MKVDVIYAEGSIRSLDTDSFTKPEPFDGANMLTEFHVDLRDVEARGLWLEAHFYDANPAYRAQAEQGTTPIAHVRRGWRFLLAEAGEMSRVDSVVLDGCCALQRVCGELVNVLVLDRNASVWLGNPEGMSVSERITGLFAVLCERGGGGLALAEIARECGCSLPLALELQHGGFEDAEEPEEDDGWMEEPE